MVRGGDFLYFVNKAVIHRVIHRLLTERLGRF